jgi:shikimate dehydrogenase
MENFKVSGNTQIYGIIGDPVEHSFSPGMQNSAFRAMGLDAVYVPFKVKKEDLKDAIKGVRALGIRGLNVTIPHKTEVMNYLDEIDPLAGKIGAVNTIVNSDGRLKGYNTDASGFIRSLQNAGINLKNKKSVVLGAGGAARAITFSLVDKVGKLTILNRHLESAQGLAGGLSDTRVKALELNAENLKSVLDAAEIVINTTSVGMWPDTSNSPVPTGLFKSGQIVIDVVYNPLKTRLLKQAESQGAKTISGIDMLVWQGALALELWTGQPAPAEVMKEEISRILKSHED